jgi:hypothetical protein
MADAYFDAETIPLTSVVGGRVDLTVLTEELDRMYPDDYPDHEMTAWEAGHAGTTTSGSNTSNYKH